MGVIGGDGENWAKEPPKNPIKDGVKWGLLGFFPFAIGMTIIDLVLSLEIFWVYAHLGCATLIGAVFFWIAYDSGNSKQKVL